MKTTIEIKGYQIVIDETEELVTVTAMKDDETVEEFSLELTEGEEAQGEDDIRSFDDFGGEEEDFGGEEAQDEDEDELQDEIQDEMEEEEEESENKLESFQSFINKKK
jgi:hypothetical protein